MVFFLFPYFPLPSVVKHPTKRMVRAAEVIPIFPDLDLWKNMYVVVKWPVSTENRAYFAWDFFENPA